MEQSYPTYKQYMNKECTHHEYYLGLAKVAGLHIGNDLLEKVRLALEKGDEHLNLIPIRLWDKMSRQAQDSLYRANKKLNGKPTWSLAMGVCAYKNLAEHLAEITE